MKKVALLLVGSIFIMASSMGCSVDNELERLHTTNELGIAIIYIGHAAMGMTGAQYKIDLVNQKFLVYMVPMDQEYHPQDKTAKNEGFYFVRNLDENAIDAFISACKEYRFEEWKEEYGSSELTDAHHWYIRVIYSDGTEREVSGWNIYPDTYNQMDEAFKELTGTNLLTGPPPEPTFWFFDRPVYWW